MSAQSGFDAPLKRTQHMVEGEKQTLGDYTLQPSARLSRWQWRGSGNAVAGFFHLSPTHVTLYHPDGGQSRLTLPIPTKDALLGMLAACIAIAGVAGALIVAARLWAQRS